MSSTPTSIRPIQTWPAPPLLSPCHCDNYNGTSLQPCDDALLHPLSPLLLSTSSRPTTNAGHCRHRDSYNAAVCRCLCCFPSCRRCQVGRQRTPGLRHCRSTMPPSSPDEGPRVHSNDRLPKLLTPSFVTAPSRPSDSVCRSLSSIGAREVNCACSFCACFVHVDLHAQNFC